IVEGRSHKHRFHNGHKHASPVDQKMPRTNRSENLLEEQDHQQWYRRQQEAVRLGRNLVERELRDRVFRELFVHRLVW
ncbi:MAG: hypothetical protein MKZ95_16800, partial [Pirellulales bacterium]|nr:hypothetical protein [Pirellulales bacterium]